MFKRPAIRPYEVDATSHLSAETLHKLMCIFERLRVGTVLACLVLVLSRWKITSRYGLIPYPCRLTEKRQNLDDVTYWFLFLVGLFRAGDLLHMPTSYSE